MGSQLDRNTSQLQKSRKTKQKPSGKRKIEETQVTFSKGKSRCEGVEKWQNKRRQTNGEARENMRVWTHHHTPELGRPRKAW